MNTRSFSILLLLLVVAGAVCAQTRFSGELKCTKGDPVYTLAVPDRPDHTFWLGKSWCTWIKPIVIEGISGQSEEVTYFSDLIGEKSRSHSTNVGTMSNGDKYLVQTQATGVVKNGIIQSADVKWTWTGLSGKLKGVAAKGTSKGKGAPDGSATWAVEGEYQVKK